MKLDYAPAPANRRPGYLERIARWIAETIVGGIYAVILFGGAIIVPMATAENWALCLLSTASFLVVMAGVGWSLKKFLYR